MKKLTFTLLLIIGTVSALYAQQSVKDDIFDFLKHEGYVPTLDTDGDVQFKLQGTTYNVILKEIASANYTYVEIVAGFTTKTPYDKLLAISNDLNQNKFVCKCSAERNGEDNGFNVAMEFITDSRSNTLFQMAHALRLMPGWVETFKDKLTE